jgi:chromosome segregation ATPase
MAVVTTVGGEQDLDRRPGYDSGRQATPEEEAAFLARRDGILAERLAYHPSVLRQRQAENEREREAERRAQHPDPRGALRAAHAARQQARAEVTRVEELHARAHDLVVELEQRQAGLAQELRAGTAAAGQRLVEALANGSEALPTSPRVDAVQMQFEGIAGRLGVAKEALAQLEQQLAGARRRLAMAEAGVSKAIVVLAIDHAADAAAGIEAIDRQLFQRRRSLWSLSAAIHHEQRQLGEPGSLPPMVPRAIGSAIDSPVDPAWSEKLKRLAEDAEAGLD